MIESIINIGEVGLIFIFLAVAFVLFMIVID